MIKHNEARTVLCTEARTSKKKLFNLLESGSRNYEEMYNHLRRYSNLLIASDALIETEENYE